MTDFLIAEVFFQLSNLLTPGISIIETSGVTEDTPIPDIS